MTSFMVVLEVVVEVVDDGDDGDDDDDENGTPSWDGLWSP